MRGQLLFGEPVLHLPVYAAPRPVAAMGVEPHTLAYLTGTTQTLHFAGSTLQGSSPPTDVVSLAAVMELKLRSPNTRPTWLAANAPDLYDHADLQYVGVTSDAAMGGEVASPDARVYFGVTMWANWSTPNEIAVNILLDTNNDGKYEYRLANGTPTVPIFGSGPVGPLVSERMDLNRPPRRTAAAKWRIARSVRHQPVLRERDDPAGQAGRSWSEGGGGHYQLCRADDQYRYTRRAGRLYRSVASTPLRAGTTRPSVFSTRRAAHVLGQARHGSRDSARPLGLRHQPACRRAHHSQP